MNLVSTFTPSEIKNTKASVEHSPLDFYGHGGTDESPHSRFFVGREGNNVRLRVVVWSNRFEVTLEHGVKAKFSNSFGFNPNDERDRNKAFSDALFTIRLFTEGAWRG